MKEYIERGWLIDNFDTIRQNMIMRQVDKYPAACAFAIKEIKDFPAADVVSKELYEQIKWERDVALAQLEEYGVSLGEKADVVEVVRCGNCRNRYEKNWAKCQGRRPDEFCSDGVSRFKE